MASKRSAITPTTPFETTPVISATRTACDPSRAVRRTNPPLAEMSTVSSAFHVGPGSTTCVAPVLAASTASRAAGRPMVSPACGSAYTSPEAPVKVTKAPEDGTVPSAAVSTPTPLAASCARR